MPAPPRKARGGAASTKPSSHCGGCFCSGRPFFWRAALSFVQKRWVGLLHAVGDDGMSSDYYIDRDRRPEAAALDDLAAGPGAASERTDFQGIIHGVVARIHDHGVTGAITVLRRKLGDVRDEFQIAAAVRLLHGKGPQTASGKTDDHRVQIG